MTRKPALADVLRREAGGGEPKKTPPSRRGRKAVVVYLDPAVAKRLKVLAAVEDTTMQALGVAALETLLERRES